jgi:hypothetical protein
VTVPAADILAAVDEGTWNKDLGIGSFTIDYSSGYHGLPSFRMGASWMVVIAISNSKKYAIRIPKLESARKSYALDKLERMSEILEHKGTEWFPDFQLIRDALTVNGEDLPVLLMPFVEGSNLSQYIADNREDSTTLYQLIDNLLLLENDLLEEGFDHGDVSVRNILVKDSGELVLIDPDALFHTTCGVNISPELGCSSMNHPLRTSKDVGPGLCIFPIRLLTMILHVIIEDSSTISENPDPQAFFFDDIDLKNHSNSEKWARVMSLVDVEVYGPILQALEAPTLMSATELLRPDIHRVSKPTVLFPIEEMLTLTSTSLIEPLKKHRAKHHPKMRTLSLSEEFRISNQNKVTGDVDDDQ